MTATALSGRLAAPVRIVGVAAIALILFFLTTLCCTMLLCAARGTSLAEPVNWSGGVVCSLIAWLFVVSFHIRKETLSLPYSHRESFASRVDETLTELGYEVGRPAPERLLGKPTFASLLFGGAVQVQLLEGRATFSGPKISVEGLHRRLRLQSHVDSSRRTLDDSGWHLEDGRLHSVRVHFRLNPNQGHSIPAEVVEAFSQLGAAVQCEISISAQNDAGMDEAVIAKLVRDKLKNHGVAATVHKKPLLPAGTASPDAVAE